MLRFNCKSFPTSERREHDLEHPGKSESLLTSLHCKRGAALWRLKVVRFMICYCHRAKSCRSCSRFTPLLALILSSYLVLPCLARAQSSGYRIAGVVVSKIDGHPLSRVRVTVNDTKNEQKSASVVTSDDGRFEFTNVPAGKYSLHGAKRGFITSYYDQHENYWTGIVTGAGVDTENLLLKLSPSATITGQILDESGDPARNARVALYLVDHSQGLEQIRTVGNTQTDDLGTYEFPSLHAGNYFISVSAQPWYAVHPQSGNASTNDNSSNFDRTLDVSYPVTYYADTGDAESATPIPVRGGDRLQVDLHFSPVPALHLTFHLGGGRHGFSFPRLEQPSFDGMTQVEGTSVRRVSPGVVEISGVPAGRYNIHVSGPAGPTQMNGVDLTQDGQQINTSTAEALGDVKVTARMSDGTPLPKPLVVGLNSNRRAFPVTAVPTDDKGQAEVSQVAAGSYHVVAWGGGKQFSITRISAEGCEVTGHTVTITPGASASLSVTLSSGSAEVEGMVKHAGKPVGGTMVVLIPKNPEGNRDLFRRDQSDLDGTFALHDVIPGSYMLIAIENGWDLDWSRPSVIAAYAKHGQPIQIRDGSNLTVRVPQSIDVQSR
jgi:Carboxypeptidase regulatory-like domain